MLEGVVIRNKGMKPYSYFLAGIKKKKPYCTFVSDSFSVFIHFFLKFITSVKLAHSFIMVDLHLPPYHLGYLSLGCIT